MKIAVFSDIHGNYVALQECIDYALSREIDRFIFQGDYVGELAYPQKTMKLIYSLKQKYDCYFIKGNKEDYWIDYRKNGERGWKEYDSTTGSLFYTYHNLTSEDIAFFESLSCKEEVHIEGMLPFTICHGSPQRANEKMLENDDHTYDIMEKNISPYILCGHTHIQGKIEHNGKIVLNAGSVGVSLYGKGKAQFIVLESIKDKWDYEFISLDYDVEKVIKELDDCGLTQKAPAWCKVSKQLLRTGKISHGTVLARAMMLCEEKTGVCHWPDIPEEYWNLAVNEMISKEEL